MAGAGNVTLHCDVAWQAQYKSLRQVLVTYERMRCDFLVQKHRLDLHFDWRCHKDILWREAKM